MMITRTEEYQSPTAPSGVATLLEAINTMEDNGWAVKSLTHWETWGARGGGTKYQNFLVVYERQAG